MIIDDLHTVGVASLPYEADTPLIVEIPTRREGARSTGHDSDKLPKFQRSYQTIRTLNPEQENEMNNKPVDGRRRLLKLLGAGGGVVVVAQKTLPSEWVRPVVESVLLPAHAQTSGTNEPCIFPLAGKSHACIDGDGRSRDYRLHPTVVQLVSRGTDTASVLSPRLFVNSVL